MQSRARCVQKVSPCIISLALTCANSLFAGASQDRERREYAFSAAVVFFNKPALSPSCRCSSSRPYLSSPIDHEPRTTFHHPPSTLLLLPLLASNTPTRYRNQNTYHSQHCPAGHHQPTMPGLSDLATTGDVNRIEAPVTFKAYLICAFASFGGIFFGYDSGYINGVTGSQVFINLIEEPGTEALRGSYLSLITSILSAGTFFGAIIAGDVADIIGRKWTVIAGCFIYIIGKWIGGGTSPS